VIDGVGLSRCVNRRLIGRLLSEPGSCSLSCQFAYTIGVAIRLRPQSSTCDITLLVLSFSLIFSLYWRRSLAMLVDGSANSFIIYAYLNKAISTPKEVVELIREATKSRIGRTAQDSAT
jgi:hypothetical protein